MQGLKNFDFFYSFTFFMWNTKSGLKLTIKGKYLIFSDIIVNE